MKLSEKILTLRKKAGMSQEELAEKLNLSRQAVSRWEVGSAVPDAYNVLQLSKLFGVTSDYLLNDDYESDHDVPAVKLTKDAGNQKVKTVIAACASAVGLLLNFVIYILSRFIEVMVPRRVMVDGVLVYEWRGDHLGRSYKYFIDEYELEFLVFLGWALFLAGLIYIILKNSKVKNWLKKLREKLPRRR